MNRQIFFLLCLFISSRIFFINHLPVFFDSPEYLSRLSNPNYIQAMLSGHMPFHVVYIILFWPVFQISFFLKINPAFAVIFAQIIFSAIAIYCFYRFAELITNKNIAIAASSIGIILPLYWIANDTIMVESTYVNLFLISLFFLTSYVKRKTHLNFYLFLGCIFFGLSLLTHPLAILWSPFLLSIVYFLKREKIPRVLPAAIITICLAILTNGFLAAKALQIPFLTGVHKYLFGEDINVMPNVASFLTILRFIRNAFIPILQNNTAVILILTVISLIKVFKINKKLFILMFLWIFPSVIVNQWFNPLLSGRHGIIAEFGIAFIVAIFLEKRKILFFATLTYIIIVFLPAISLLNQPIPYLMEQKYVQTLPEGLLIESHFARPQVERHYSGEIIFVNEPGWSKEELKNTINNYLNDKKPVFITSQALSDPYGVYSGPFLLPLSLSYAKEFELKKIILSYSTEKYETVNKDANLTIYRISSIREPSKYPDIPKLNYNRRRMDYFDPVTQLWFFIERAMTTQSHSIIKE